MVCAGWEISLSQLPWDIHWNLNTWSARHTNFTTQKEGTIYWWSMTCLYSVLGGRRKKKKNHKKNWLGCPSGTGQLKTETMSLLHLAEKTESETQDPHFHVPSWVGRDMTFFYFTCLWTILLPTWLKVCWNLGPSCASDVHRNYGHNYWKL